MKIMTQAPGGVKLDVVMDLDNRGRRAFNCDKFVIDAYSRKTKRKIGQIEMDDDEAAALYAELCRYFGDHGGGR